MNPSIVMASFDSKGRCGTKEIVKTIREMCLISDDPLSKTLYTKIRVTIK